MALKKTIGKNTLLFLSINAIMGTGIFFLPAIGAFYSGASSIIAWLIMSVVAILMSTYFAELTSMYPKAGGIYEYTKNAFGKLHGFVIGWIAWIITNVTISMLVVGSILYLFPNANIIFSITLSLSIIILFNYISYRGIDFSAKMLLLFGIVTIGSIAILVLPGFLHINLGNFSNIGINPMILITLFFISETFFGWETTCYLSEEVKNARKVMPKTLVKATMIIAVISIALVLVSLGSSDIQTFASQSAPLAYISGIIFGKSFSNAYTILIFIPLVGTAASWIISSPRLLFAMSRDKVLPKGFSKINEKFHSPQNAIIFQTIATSVITLIAFGNYENLLSSLIPLVIIAYSAVLLSVIKLRIKKPNIKRYYKAPLGIYGAVALIIFNLGLLWIWLTTVHDAFSVFLMDMFLIMLGVPLYFLIKLQTDKKFIEKFYDKLSFFWDKYFPLWYTSKETKFVVSKIKIKKGMKVLDFGSGSGITTLEMAKKIKNNGVIVAVDISEKQLEKAFYKVRKAEKISDVIFIKHSELDFEPETFDAVVAVGVLEHLEKPEETIETLIKLLKPGGQFSFLSFGKSFGMPGSEFISDWKSMKEYLLDLGVKPSVRFEKKKFTEYIFMWGTKKK